MIEIVAVVVHRWHLNERLAAIVVVDRVQIVMLIIAIVASIAVVVAVRIRVGEIVSVLLIS